MTTFIQLNSSSMGPGQWVLKEDSTLILLEPQKGVGLEDTEKGTKWEITYGRDIRVYIMDGDVVMPFLGRKGFFPPEGQIPNDKQELVFRAPESELRVSYRRSERR